MVLICYCLIELSLLKEYPTKQRVEYYNLIILFSTTEISPVVYEEIPFAYSHLQDKSKILVIHDEAVGNAQKLKDKFTYVGINRSSKIEVILDKIIDEIKRIHTKRNAQNGFLSTLGGIVLTGIALFALSSALEEPPRQKRVIKRKPVKRIKMASKRIVA
jgi:hypothetical protein